MSHDHKEDNHAKISTARLEAFSDGVFAIIITLTVFELKVPLGGIKEVLFPLIPLFITYIISFHLVATYWINHHHLLQATNHVSPGIMWANLHLLFWLSLIPFATGWLGENHDSSLPTAFYSLILCACAIAYTILQEMVVRHAENKQALMEEIKQSWKGKISLASYLLAIPFAFVHPAISDVLIVVVAMMWFLPDQRIAKHL